MNVLNFTEQYMALTTEVPTGVGLYKKDISVALPSQKRRIAALKGKGLTTRTTDVWKSWK